MCGANGKHCVDVETGTPASVYNDCRYRQLPHAWRQKGERHVSKIPVSFFSASLDVEFPLAKPQVKATETVTWAARTNAVLAKCVGTPDRGDARLSYGLPTI